MAPSRTELVTTGSTGQEQRANELSRLGRTAVLEELLRCDRIFTTSRRLELFEDRREQT